MIPIRITIVALLVCPAVLLAGCTGGGSDPAPTTPAGTVTRTETQPVPSPHPVIAGPTTAARAADCPFASQHFVQYTMGMRLGRVAVLRSGGRVVGCRIYALQGGILHRNEHLPGPNQPAVEISTQRYTSADGAHNAFVEIAIKGANPQRVSLDGTPGVCFQTDFYPADKGKDWACATSKDRTSVLVQSVDTTQTTGTVTVTKKVLGAL